MKDCIYTENQSGGTTFFQGTSITPFFQSVKLALPGFPFSFIWKRPISVLLTNKNGKETVIPIQDITRQIILGIFGFSLMFWIVTKLTFKETR